MLGLGGFLEFDALGIGFIITGLDNFDLERWTATSTASAPEGGSKDSTALISIQGLWICDIYFPRELGARCWLNYAVHVRDRLYQTTTSTASTPEGSSKDLTALISIQGLMDLQRTFSEGARDESLVKICCPPRSGKQAEISRHL